MILGRRSEIQKVIMSKENGKVWVKLRTKEACELETRSTKKTPGRDGFTGQFYQKYTSFWIVERKNTSFIQTILDNRIRGKTQLILYN